MSELCHFIASLVARRGEQVAHAAEIVRAEHYTAAEAAALEMCKQLFPKSDGWSEWSVATNALYISNPPVACTHSKASKKP